MAEQQASVGPFTILTKLGQGSFATVSPETVSRSRTCAHARVRARARRIPQVWLGQSRISSSDRLAIKIINCERLSGKIRGNLDSEISILQQYRHPNIVQLLGTQVRAALSVAGAL